MAATHIYMAPRTRMALQTCALLRGASMARVVADALAEFIERHGLLKGASGGSGRTPTTRGAARQLRRPRRRACSTGTSNRSWRTDRWRTSNRSKHSSQKRASRRLLRSGSSKSACSITTAPRTRKQRRCALPRISTGRGKRRSSACARPLSAPTVRPQSRRVTRSRGTVCARLALWNAATSTRRRRWKRHSKPLLWRGASFCRSMLSCMRRSAPSA